MLLPDGHEDRRRAIRELYTAMEQDKRDQTDTAAAIAARIEEGERASGSRFLIVDGRPCLFSRYAQKLLDIGKNRSWDAHLFSVYGLNPHDKRFTSKVTKALETHCLCFGEKRSVRRWTAFQDGVLHINNYDGTTWVVRGDGVSIDDKGRVSDVGWGSGGKYGIQPEIMAFGREPNGSTIVFTDDDEGLGCDNPIIKRSGKLFRTVLRGVTFAEKTAGRMKPKHQMQALIIWMFALAFPDMFPTKPLLILEGAPGSGKTATIQMIQAMLHGKVRPTIISKNGERDFRVALLRSPIMLLDNVDEYIDWIPNTVAAYTTGAYWSDRELHTNTGVVTIKPESFLAVASKNPQSFRTADVADRSIVLRFESRRNRGETCVPMNQIYETIFGTRPELFGAWLYFLNRIVAVLNLGLIGSYGHRMADWEHFAWCVGIAMNWKKHVIPELMDVMQRERVSFAGENDVLVEVLEQWLDVPGNEGRAISGRVLFGEMRLLSEYDGKAFLKSSVALAQRLRAPHVQEKFFIDDNVLDDHGRRVYRISKSLEVGVLN